MKNYHEGFIPVLTPDDSVLSTLSEANLKSEAYKDALLSIKALIDNSLAANKIGVIVELCPESLSQKLSTSRIHDFSPLLGELYGDLLVQNEAGDKVISVYDRDRYGSMFQGARYHQTREGGSIHTDNVNIPEPWEYLILTCLSPALVGGENILVNAIEVHRELAKNYPDVLATLEQNFTWEMRGVSESLYEAPIVTYNDQGLPLFRHLRPYMESAHQKAQRPLSAEQLYALDVLDALTNTSSFQQRYRMKAGDVLFTLDSQVLHGRTCFSDAFHAIAYPEYMKDQTKLLKRTMERLWVKK